MNYLEEIKKAMELLNKEGFYFIGQCVKFSGTSMYHTIKHIDIDRRIELPIFEDVQAGMATGMALEGLKVCSIYPRMDFLILATNQIVNHLDRIAMMSDNQFNPFVIIRTCVGSTKPLFSGEQHSGNYVQALRSMCKYIKVYELKTAEEVIPTYEKALKEKIPCIIVEYPDLYNESMIDELKASREVKVSK